MKWHMLCPKGTSLLYYNNSAKSITVDAASPDSIYPAYTAGLNNHHLQARNCSHPSCPSTFDTSPVSLLGLGKGVVVVASAAGFCGYWCIAFGRGRGLSWRHPLGSSRPDQNRKGNLWIRQTRRFRVEEVVDVDVVTCA